MWDLTPEEIAALTEAAIAHCRAAYDSVANAGDNLTFSSTLLVMEAADTDIHCCESVCTFPKHMSTDKAIRDAANEAEKKFDAFGVECTMRYDVYQVIAAFAKIAGEGCSELLWGAAPNTEANS